MFAFIPLAIMQLPFIVRFLCLPFCTSSLLITLVLPIILVLQQLLHIPAPFIAVRFRCSRWWTTASNACAVRPLMILKWVYAVQHCTDCKVSK